MSFSGGGGQIPVQALLKLTLDQAGADTIQKFLDGHEQQWSRVEGSINRISAGVQEITRFGMGALGVAGIGALAQNFIGSSTAGSNVALAAGQMTGGAGAWHPYSQAMLGAQAKTGVPSTQIAQGLILALQSVGGSPSPNQASILGGLLAGFGQVEGLSPAQVSQIVSPMLQASNKPLTAANLSGVLAATQATLTATPGSQSGPQLALVSSIAQQQALGGIAPQPVQTAALLNAAMQTNRLWRDTGVSGGATSSIQSGLQGAFQNPSQEAFMTMAGISYADQRAGMTAGNVHKIMAAATRQYGTGPTRDIMLRSMFGLSGADLLETFSPGSAASKILAEHPGATHAQIRAVQHAAQHPQAGSTPQSWLDKVAGSIFGFAESGPLGAAATVAGGYGLLRAPGLAAKGLGALARGAGAGLGGDALGAIGGGILGGVTLGLSEAAAAMLFPDSISGSHLTGNQTEKTAVSQVLKMAQAKFGEKNLHSAKARNWMQQQLYQGGGSVYGSAVEAQGGFDRGKYAPGAGKLLDSLLGDQYAQHTGGQDAITTFAQAATKLLRFADKLGGGTSAHGASYQLGSGGLGTPAIQAMGASAPGMMFAALTAGASSGSSGSMGSSLFASLLTGGTPSGGSSAAVGGAATGAGWSPCTLTWYDPALGGTNSGNGAANPTSPTASGTPYSATAYTCAAPPAYAFGTQIEFAYGGKTVTCKVNDRGGAITGAHFDLARAPATALGMISAGNVSAKFKVVSSGSSSSGSSSGGGSGRVASAAVTSGGGSTGGGGASYAAAAMMGAGAAGGGSGGVTHIHNHIYIDGKEIRKARILRGHKP